MATAHTHLRTDCSPWDRALRFVVTSSMAQSGGTDSELPESLPAVLRERKGAARHRVDRLLQAAMARFLLPRTSDGPQAIRMRSFLIAAGTALLVMGLLFACHIQGSLPRDAFLAIAAASALAIVAFFVVFRTGINQRAADPSLTVPQMAVATAIVLFAEYSSNAGAIGVYAVVLTMIFLFGVLRLRTRQMLFFAAFMLAAHAAVLMLRWRFKPEAQDVSEHVLQWVVLAVTLPWFALMGGYISALREQLRQSNLAQRNALQTIKASESRLAEAQRIGGLGSWTFDVAQRVAVWSPEAYRVFGMEPGAPIPRGDAFLQIVHPGDRQTYLDLIRPALDQGRGFDSQYRIVLPGGIVRWLHVVGEPVVGADGKTTLLRGTVMDITARKVQEDAVKSARDQAAAAQGFADRRHRKPYRSLRAVRRGGSTDAVQSPLCAALHGPGRLRRHRRVDLRGPGARFGEKRRSHPA